MAVNSNSDYDISPEMPGVIDCFLDLLFKVESSSSSLLLNKSGDAKVNNRSLMNKKLDYVKVVSSMSESFCSQIFLDESSKKIIGWKENNINPAYHSYDKCYRYIKQLGEVFPGIRYIINIRNPSDTSKSAMWRNRTNAYDLIIENNKFFQDLSDTVLQSNSVLVNYDIWSKDAGYLVRELKKLDINLDQEKVSNVFNTRYNHLKIW